MSKINKLSTTHVLFAGIFCVTIVAGCVQPAGEKDEPGTSVSTTPAVVVQPAANTTTTNQPRQPTPEPTVPSPTAESGLPTGEQWAKLRNCESSGRYDISSRNGKYHGAYQFSQATWNATASSAGRDDLVGVKPSEASNDDQDSLAVALYRERGSQPWGPKCGAFLN